MKDKFCIKKNLFVFIFIILLLGAYFIFSSQINRARKSLFSSAKSITKSIIKQLPTITPYRAPTPNPMQLMPPLRTPQPPNAVPTLSPELSTVPEPSLSDLSDEDLTYILTYDFVYFLANEISRWPGLLEDSIERGYSLVDYYNKYGDPIIYTTLGYGPTKKTDLYAELERRQLDKKYPENTYTHYDYNQTVRNLTYEMYEINRSLENSESIPIADPFEQTAPTCEEVFKALNYNMAHSWWSDPGAKTYSQIRTAVRKEVNLPANIDNDLIKIIFQYVIYIPNDSGLSYHFVELRRGRNIFPETYSRKMSVEEAISFLYNKCGDRYKFANTKYGSLVIYDKKAIDQATKILLEIADQGLTSRDYSFPENAGKNLNEFYAIVSTLFSQLPYYTSVFIIP